jgi:hypothetical protein
MAIKAVISSVTKNRISINKQERDVVRTVALGGGGGSSTLEGLSDVISTNKANNHTLVYDAVSEKYVVKELPVLDGGTY